MVRIDSLASGGEGVGRLEDGRVVFVHGGCPGDLVEIEPLAEKKRWALAAVTKIVEPSPDRVVPPCPYFGACGGCQWQHVSYSAQLTAKRRIVADALERIGGLVVADVLADCRPSPKLYGYRNKLELVPVCQRPLGLGFHRLASDNVLEIDRCLLLPERLETAPQRLAGALRYASGSGDLAVRRVGIRVAQATHDVEVALWTAPSAFPRRTVATTLTAAVGATSVVRVLAKEDGRRHTASQVEVLEGHGHWTERLGRFSYAVSAPSFFQVNTPAAELLVQEVRKALNTDGTDDVADLFAGVGTFTLPLTDDARSVTAVEASRFALRDLRDNLETARRSARVEGGDAERVLKGLGHFDAVLVDPPRTGLTAATVATVMQARPAKIVYISCDPATLARDAKTIVASGYRLVSAVPVDLFPQTYHTESVALFETR